MLVLFTLLSVATSVFTITALNRHLVSQIDEQLAASITAPRQPGVTQLGE
jgi:two-component system OmpR family sensor kinase